MLTVVQGHYNQGNRRFGDSAGSQCSCIAFYASAFTKIKSVARWIAKDIDAILERGDELYKEQQVVLNSRNRYLNLDELPHSVTVSGVTATSHIDVKDQVYLFSTNASQDTSFELCRDIKLSLIQFDKTVLAVIGTKTVLFVYGGNNRNPPLFCFDSHSRDAYGRICANGAAVLMKFASAEDAIKCYRDEMLDSPNDTLIQIGYVSISFQQLSAQQRHSMVIRHLTQDNLTRRRTQKRTYNEINKQAITQRQAGYDNSNRESIAKRRAAYNEENREAINQRQAQYNDAHRETIAERQTTYNEENREAINQRQAQYNDAHRDTIAQRQTTYNEDNREAINQRQAQYDDTHRETIAKRQTTYNEDNRETINQRQAQYNDAHRDTIAERQTTYNEDNREAINQRQAQYNDAHRDTIAQRQTAYNEENREAINQRQAQYNDAHRDTIAQRQTAYNEENREAINQRQAQYDDTHRETIAQRQTTYNEDNRETINQRQAQYNDAHRDTIAERQTTYNEDNREAINQRQAQYDDTHRETIAQRQTAYNEENREAINQRQAQYDDTHRETIAQRQTAYNEENREAINQRQAQYDNDHRDTIAQRRVTHNATNRDAITRRQAIYNAENRETIAQNQAARKSNQPEFSQSRLIQQYRKEINIGPVYICVSCHRKMYRKYVVQLNRGKYPTDEYWTSKVSCDGKMYICKTCQEHIRKNKMPPQCVHNKLHVCELPHEISELSLLECLCICKRLLFMKLVIMPSGRQRKLHGAAVMVPIEVSNLVQLLPQLPSQAGIIQLKLKRKLEYTGHSYFELFRVDLVIDATRKLCEINPLYADVRINEELSLPDEQNEDISMTYPQPEHAEMNQPTMEITANASMQNDQRDAQECSVPDDHNNQYFEIHSPEPQDPTALCVGDDTLVYSPQPEHAQVMLSETAEMPVNDSISNNRIDSDSEDEDELDLNRAPVKATCLQPANGNITEFENIVSIAPGEGKVPVNIYSEPHGEMLAFPYLFPDGKFGFTETRDVNLSPIRYFNVRLLNCDGRFAASAEFIFYALSIVEQYKVSNAISIAMQKLHGSSITAGSLRNPQTMKQYRFNDQLFMFMAPIKGTPAYWKTFLYEVLAMVRQLGIPQWFLTLSCADLRWVDLLRILLLQRGKNYTDDEIAALTYNERCDLINSDPVTVARHYQLRVDTFVQKILKKIHCKSPWAITILRR